jgi:hypothetical protein
MLFAAVLAALANASQPFPYLAELRQQEGALSQQAEPGPKRKFSLMMLAYAQSYVDASARAGDTFNSRADDSPAGPPTDGAERARQILSGHEPRDALAAIVDAARERQIVIINESHVTPRHRAFSTRLALELRKLGFQYLAVETLDNDTPEVVAALRARGYPLAQDGYYSREPLFGDLLRQSLRAGYQLVAYEFTGYDDAYEKLDAAEQQRIREDGQAQNIIDHILARDPKARILVHVGHGHVLETPIEIEGKPVDMMAASLRRKTGIDPLSIEQTRSAFPEDVAEDRPLMDAVLRTFTGESFAMVRRDGVGYWNSGNVDMTIWHRPEKLQRGRPDWLGMDGYRRSKKIPAKLLPKQGRRLIQAFVEGESPDAVPMDQVLVTAGSTPPVFMLPKGKYRFAYQE